MPNPVLSDVHVDRPLTTMSVGFVQDASDFVAGQVFPQIPVTNKTDLYFVYNRADFFRNTMQKRAPNATAATGGYKLTTAQYIADVWALNTIISDQIRANSDSPLQPDRDATYWLTQQALINRETNWVSAYFTTGVWGTDITGVASGTPGATEALMWDKSGSTPIEDVLKGQKTIKKATGYWPNVLVLGADVFMALLTNAEITDRLKYGQTAPGPVVVTTADLAALFKVEKVLVASAIQTTTAENQNASADTIPDTFDFIAGKNAGLFYAAKAPGIMQPSAGYTFNWTGLTGSTAAGMRIKKFRWEIVEGDYVEMEAAYAFGLVSKYLGFFWSGIVA